MTNKYLKAVLEIGESSSKLVIASFHRERIQICGSYCTPTYGITNGEIMNKNEINRTIRQLLERTNEDHLTVDKVLLILPSKDLSVFRKKAQSRTTSYDRRIISYDIELLRKACLKHNVNENDLVVSVYPIHYIVDEAVMEKSPVGLVADFVTLDAYILTLPKSIARGYTDVIEELHLEIEDVICEPIAQYHGVLSNDELRDGVAVIDIGGFYSSLSVFVNGLLFGTRNFKFGGNDLSSILTTKFNIDYVNAEQLKIDSNIALSTSNNEPFFELKNDKKIVKKQIEEIFAPKLLSLVEDIKRALKFLNVKEDLPIVLTGGSSESTIIRDYLKTNGLRLMEERSSKLIGARGAIYNNCLGALAKRYGINQKFWLDENQE